MCLCPAWFSGETCSQSLNPCSNPTACANNATCVPNYDVKPNGYTCQCLPGFTGQMCEVNVDDCATQPCRRGRCIDRVNGFICTCYSGSDGVLCDVRILDFLVHLFIYLCSLTRRMMLMHVLVFHAEIMVYV